MKKVLILAALLAAGAAQAAPLKQMPIEFVGEWCNGSTYEGEVNWTLPSWVEESVNDGKCGNILSVTSYGFSMVIDKKSYDCMPDTIRQSQDTAPSGTAYLATISAHCRIGDEQGRGQPATFAFHRYKGNIYIKPKK